jgi:hypothetical protein
MKNKFVKTFILPVLLMLFSTSAYTQQNKPVAVKQTNTPPAKYQKMPTVSPEVLARPFNYTEFLKKEKDGLIPSQAGPVVQDKSARMPVKNVGEPNPTALSTPDVLVNNNAGATGTGNFTQSETTITAFGNNVVIGFNDAGSNAGGANKFTGWSRSTDGGATFTDGGSLPTTAGGDAGDPILARNNTTGRIYFSTLGFTAPTIQMWRSDDNGITWLPPVNATPGGRF